MCQSSVVGTEPDAAVPCRTASHHDIVCQVAVACRIMRQQLTVFGVIYLDAAIVGAQPPVTVSVLGDGVDVADLQVAHAGLPVQVLAEPVFVRAHPDVSAGVYEYALTGVVADGRFIVLVVQELS